ncbi:MAG: translation initiation factor IF-2 N-terminal domain-containing protein, partial [Terracidiphilus sp.]
MNKIRINELARELEVKAHEILDHLPELGVQEKKTHSSSIDEDVAIKLRRLFGHDVPDLPAEDAVEAEPQAAPSAPPAAARPERSAEVAPAAQQRPVVQAPAAAEEPAAAPSLG